VEYRRLGRSGVKVSAISLGSWLTYGGSVAEEQARACIHKAYELGINFFDTANVYMRGAAEEIVGRALKDFERDSYFLATKVYFPMEDNRTMPRLAEASRCRLRGPLPVSPLRRRHAARRNPADS
jgi:aryl-alcohol dehydrogenase-like predicted oxidoreductase